MKAICASVNFDLFMVLPRPTARIAHAAKLEFSSNDRSENREAGHVKGGRDASSLVANCSDFLVKDTKTRTVLACATKAGSDGSKLAGCAASSVLPPEVARYAACAATSRGPTQFALCAAGPMMNEEWRIAAECAVQTG